MAEAYISELGDSLSHGVANTNGDRVKIIAPKLYNDGNGNHPSIATALSGKVSKSGDTMTGQLVNTMTGEAIKVSHGTGNKDAFVSAERTDQSVKVSFGVGAGGVNHGLYSNKNSNWIIKADTSANVTINDGKAGTTIYLGNSNVGAANKPMYLASGKISEGSLYAGGTAVTLNGTSAAASTASFYAPTGAGTSGQFLKSAGSGAPSWANLATADIQNARRWVAASSSKVSGDTRWWKILKLKGITSSNYNCAQFHLQTAFWNNQFYASILLWVSWERCGGQGDTVSVASRKFAIAGNYDIPIYYDRDATNNTVEIYIQVPNAGNSYGQWFINLLNSPSPSISECVEFIANNDGVRNLTLPDTAVQVSSTIAAGAVRDGDGNTISSTYLKLSGGTMTGKLNATSNQYSDAYNGGALNMNNSNIDGVHSIYTADASETANEGIHFYRDATHTDTLWMRDGHMYFVPNRTLVGSGTGVSAADSRKVAILPASITTNQMVVTDGTNGYVKGVSASDARTAIGAAASDHTHTTAIASDSSSGTVVTLAHDTQYKLTAGGTSVLFKTPADSNTDTKVTQTADNSSTGTGFEVLFSATADNTTRTEASRKSSKLTFQPSTGTLTATKFSGPLTGNVTGNCSGSSGSCTGNAATATKATNDSDGNAINATYFKSSGNVTLVSGTATKIGTQNGTDVKLTLPTIPEAANNGALQLQLNGGNATSKFTANQSGNSTLAFSTGSTAGTFKVDSTEIAIAGFTKVESSSTNGNIKINGTETTVYTHPTSGANVSKGDTTNQTPGFGSTFKVTSGTVDNMGHTTTFAEHTVKIPNATATSSAAGLMSADDYKRLNGSRDIGEHDADLCTVDGFYYGSSNMPATSLGWTERSEGNDGALFVQAYSTSWVGQIGQDYRTGNLFTRGRNNGTFTSWKRIPYLTVKNKGGTTTPVYVDANGEIQSCTAYASATVGTATNSTNSAVTADTTHQLYLIGATGSSGQQALKTDTGIYATATAGQLHATTFDVNSKCTLQFNTTTNALDFVFA